MISSFNNTLNLPGDFSESILLITGGTGFFGKALLRYWKCKKFVFKKIYILSRNPDSFLAEHSSLIDNLNVHFIKIDILKASEIKLTENVDYVMHLATDTSAGPSLSRLNLFNQIVKGTEEILKFAANHGVKKVLFTSSGAVYGSQPSQLDKIPEDYLGALDPMNVHSTYGLGKKAAEHLISLHAESYEFDYVVARCFAFIGQDLPLNARYAIGNIIRDALNERDITLSGDGSPQRSYLHQDDLACCLTSMLLNSTKYKIYNVGSDIGITIEELATKIRDKFAPSKKIILNCERELNPNNRYIPNIDRLKAEFLQNGFMQLDASLDEIVR